MKLKKTDWLAIAILIALLVQLIIMYPTLPEHIPSNWGTNGKVSYEHKSTIWLLYGSAVFMFPLFFIVPKIDPKGETYDKIEGFYSAFRLVMIIFMGVMLEITLLSANDAHRFDVDKIVMIAVSGLLIFIGNYLPKCKQNYTMGIKTMWTLADERVWNDTHRVGGLLFFIIGVISLIACFLLKEEPVLIISVGGMLAAIAFTVLYSYLSYRKYNPKQ